MLDEFKKAKEEKEKRKEDNFENLIMPDTADKTKLAEDGRPMTPQLQEIMDMREEVQENKPKPNEIKVRDTDLPEIPGKTINSNLRELPKLCDQCYLIDKCPYYEPGATCYFRNQVKVEGRDSLVELMKMLLEVQGERVMFGRLIEQSEGGYIDQNLSKEMKLLMELMKDFKEVLSEPRDEITIKASTKPGSGGGILSEIFGGGNNEDNR